MRRRHLGARFCRTCFVLGKAHLPLYGPCACSAHGEEGDLTASSGDALTADEAIANYNHAAVAGIVSIMSKMGISTVQSYHSAQIFEAVGLTESLVERYVTGRLTRGRLGVTDVERELNERFDAAAQQQLAPAPNALPSLGLTKWRPVGGEDHLIDPDTIYLLQQAVRENSFDTFPRL